MMEKSIIAVTSGSYSDYRVKGIFTARELAQAYYDELALVNPDTEIETFPLNPEPIEVTIGILVTMYLSGDAVRLSSEPFHCQPKKIGFQSYGGFKKEGEGWPLTYIVETEDRERAVRVVNEKRVMILAANAWDDEKLTREVLGQPKVIYIR